ncbi:MAG: hypothetical protein WBA79_10795 [Mycobacterium sp.]
MVLGVAVGGAIAAAVVVGIGTANAQNSDLASVLVSSLGDVSALADHDVALLTAELGVPNAAAFSVATLADANANLSEGIDALKQQFEVDPTASGLSAAISIQGRSSDYLDRLQDAQDNISAHAGSLSPTIENLFFDPLNQYWLTTSESVLTADHAFADALANDLDRWDVLDARAAVSLIDVQLVGLQYLSAPIVYFSDFLDLFGE